MVNINGMQIIKLSLKLSLDSYQQKLTKTRCFSKVLIQMELTRNINSGQVAVTV